MLGIPGEELLFVTHSLSDFKKRLKCSKRRGRPGSALVVGAGMTSADAVLYCLDNDIHVNHSFYQDLSKANNLLLSKLPSGYYLEYQRVWKLMKGLETSHLYTPLEGTRVRSFSTNGETILTSSSEIEQSLATSVGMIAIGSQANLGFLPQDISSVLGIDPSQAIDSKNNSVDIDSFLSQSERVPNLYALGPLAGDNFVRFLFGSGLACAKSIQNSLCKTNLSPTQSILSSTQTNDSTIL
ncbi:PREDICTED: oxidative stress-induced growth inhibitor 2-like [Amphimedon queenslandica]|uniref:FAD/NAD(P)-binding domain-containing protein n=1 Tax=Amphimedon queenslandica TaxID=400682 RepID=A0A1X7TQX1_AMPQE|nr:PREDICTED: oxidative stress-induced growth inhibitor 2-like [Amphimedon queenslandica]|eukprot:XP_011407028.1 PREDICTED: oxidative stress-induced growth inhibitor 2-like [Amphimedon queenslandica]